MDDKLRAAMNVAGKAEPKVVNDEVLESIEQDLAKELGAKFGAPAQASADDPKLRSKAEIAFEAALNVLGGDNYSPSHTQLVIEFFKKLAAKHEQSAQRLRSDKEIARDLLLSETNRLRTEADAAIAKLQDEGALKLQALESELSEVITRHDGVTAHLNRLLNGSGIKAKENQALDTYQYAQDAAQLQKNAKTKFGGAEPSKETPAPTDVVGKIAAADDLAAAGANTTNEKPQTEKAETNGAN